MQLESTNQRRWPFTTQGPLKDKTSVDQFICLQVSLLVDTDVTLDNLSERLLEEVSGDSWPTTTAAVIDILVDPAISLTSFTTFVNSNIAMERHEKQCF